MKTQKKLGSALAALCVAAVTVAQLFETAKRTVGAWRCGHS